MNAVRSRSSGSRTGAIVALLLACVPLIVILAFQAHHAVTSHRLVAESVLADYGALAAHELQRRISGEIGYRGYYGLIAALREGLAAGSLDLAAGEPFAGENEAPAGAELAAGYLLFDPQDRRLYVAPEPLDEATRAALVSNLATMTSVEGAGAEGFVGLHVPGTGGSTRSFVVGAAPPTDPVDRIIGFEVDFNALSSWFERAVNRGPLLPPSLVDGELGSETVFVAVSPPRGPEIFRLGRRFEPDLAVEVVIGDDYGGIFEGYRLTVAVDPAAASRLVIGGLPRSRVPVLVLVLAVTIGLVVAAIYLLQRERAVDGLRSDFVSRISHELRTPLTQIRMFSETLLLERTRGSGEQRQAIQVIDRESRRLTHLVENLLQFSRGQRGALTVAPRRRCLADLLRDIVRELQPLIRAKGDRVTLALDPDIETEVDEEALHQIVSNLIDNALKYGPTGQEIQIRLSAVGGMVRLTVEDEGRGVPPADRDRIWDRYVRLDRDRSSAIAGTGIGLTVVRELVASHDGRVAVENGHRGARFVVELPLAPPRSGLAVPEAEVEKAE